MLLTCTKVWKYNNFEIKISNIEILDWTLKVWSIYLKVHATFYIKGQAIDLATFYIHGLAIDQLILLHLDCFNNKTTFLTDILLFVITQCTVQRSIQSETLICTLSFIIILWYTIKDVFSQYESKENLNKTDTMYK